MEDLWPVLTSTIHYPCEVELFPRLGVLTWKLGDFRRLSLSFCYKMVILKDTYSPSTSLKLINLCQKLGRESVPISKWESCWNGSQETQVLVSLLLLRPDKHTVHLEHWNCFSYN